MTEHEIERLREKLGGDYSVKRLNGAITVELVDIWKGVEFAECVEYCKGTRTENEIIEGEIYRIKDLFKRELVYLDGFEYGWPVSFFNPSTEAAYVEQLKAKAHELYGQIKDGDRFELDGVEFRVPIEFELRYVSEHDKLVLDNYMKCPHIYQQGKWAKKVEEPIRVHFESSSKGLVGGKVIAWFQFELSKDANIHSSGVHLAKCLEDYLNNS